MRVSREAIEQQVGTRAPSTRFTEMGAAFVALLSAGLLIAGVLLSVSITIAAPAAEVKGAGACQLELAAPPAVLRLRYDPFDATPAKASTPVQIRNTGNGACEAAIALFRAGPRQARANGPDSLSYDITDFRGASLIAYGLTPLARLAPSFAPATVTVAPGATATLELTAVTPRGQIAPPGEYADALDIGLYRADGQAYERSAGSGRLHLVISAVAVMRLTLAGGGRKTTLDFGELTEGATRLVMLQAYANQGFRLRASSENGGRMLPTDAAAQAEGGWQAPYTVSLNRAGYLALDAERAIDITPAATGLAGLAIPVEIRIGSIAKQRAGLYRDVITLTATPKI